MALMFAMMGIEIKDKTTSLAGVNVGMKKATALKVLQKHFGAKAVVYDSLSQAIKVAQGGMMPILYYVKSSKVSSISWMHS